MHKFVILSDSTMDIPKNLREKYEIEFPVLGKIIYSNKGEEDCDMDWEKGTPEQFFDIVRDKNVKVTTAYPNEFEVQRRCKEYLEKGQDIICITLSGGMSGTYNCFYKTAKDLNLLYPDRKIFVIDSRRYGAGMGLLCIYASKLREEGKTVDETYEELVKRVPCVRQIGILDDLMFLARSGRLPKTKAFFGTFAGVKPLSEFSNETGMCMPLSPAPRGYKAAFRTIIEMTKKEVSNERPRLMLVQYGLRETQGQQLFEAVKKELNPDELYVCRTGQSNGANMGPGLIAVFFFSEKPVSPNCEEETAILKGILGK